ncbi:acyl carrier protein [Pendulispora albinea]|uniref:Acyl carrier protein n=1 Tax=Pendulispora albinea TaxID=2741071 RepID=A0ABZ2MAQ9_9BACT
MTSRNHVTRLFAAAEIHISESELDDSRPLAQQGFDSLDMVNLLFQIEQTYQVSISPEDASHLRSIRDLVDYIAAHGNAGATT